MAKHIRKPAPRFDRTRQPETKARALSRKGQRITAAHDFAARIKALGKMA